MNNIMIDGVKVFPIGTTFYFSQELKLFYFNSRLKSYVSKEADMILESINLNEEERKISFSAITKRGKKFFRSTYFFPYSRLFNDLNWEEYKRELNCFLGKNASTMVFKM